MPCEKPSRASCGLTSNLEKHAVCVCVWGGSTHSLFSPDVPKFSIAEFLQENGSNLEVERKKKIDASRTERKNLATVQFVFPFPWATLQ